MRPIFDGNFNFENHIELEYVLDNLNPKIAINILELGIEQGLREGIFDLTEVHCLYKSLIFLKNYEDKNNNLFNDNNDGDNN